MVDFLTTVTELTGSRGAPPHSRAEDSLPHEVDDLEPQRLKVHHLRARRHVWIPGRWVEVEIHNTFLILFGKEKTFLLFFRPVYPVGGPRLFHLLGVDCRLYFSG